MEMLGVRDVRFTGGEPLLRRSLPSIVAATKALPSRPRTAMTSNGLGLKHTARALADAGLDRVNISLDTTDPATFEKITRRDRLHDVIDGLAAAREAGLTPVKVNAVLLRGINEHEAPDLLRWCMEHEYELRFIEQMPLDAQHGWSREAMVTADETLGAAGGALRADRDGRTWVGAGREVPRRRRTAHRRHHRLGHPAVLRRLQPGAADRRRSDPATACSRARSPTCARRCASGATDVQIAERWAAAMMTKLPGHGIDDPTFLQSDRPMSAIGG